MGSGISAANRHPSQKRPNHNLIRYYA